MFNIFKNRNKSLEKKGYLLVVTYDHKEHITINHIFDRKISTFEKKKIFTVNTITPSSYFSNVNDAITEVSGKKDFKRFLAGNNVTGIYYVELEIKEKEKNSFVIDSNLFKLFYIPSKMQMVISEN